jgi:hypothetical protein
MCHWRYSMAYEMADSTLDKTTKMLCDTQVHDCTLVATAQD